MDTPEHLKVRHPGRLAVQPSRGQLGLWEEPLEWGGAGAAFYPILSWSPSGSTPSLSALRLLCHHPHLVFSETNSPSTLPFYTKTNTLGRGAIPAGSHPPPTTTEPATPSPLHHILLSGWRRPVFALLLLRGRDGNDLYPALWSLSASHFISTPSHLWEAEGKGEGKRRATLAQQPTTLWISHARRAPHPHPCWPEPPAPQGRGSPSRHLLPLSRSSGLQVCLLCPRCPGRWQRDWWMD